MFIGILGDFYVYFVVNQRNRCKNTLWELNIFKKPSICPWICQGIANQLQLKQSWQAREYMAAMRVYSGVKVMQIIGEIRYCDAKSKGVENASLSDGDLLRELVYKILHW